MVDMLLRELLGGERPPNLKGRILRSADELTLNAPVSQVAVMKVIPLASAKTSKLPMLSAIAAVFVVGAICVFAYATIVSKSRTPELISVSGEASQESGVISVGGSLVTGAHSSAVLRYEDGTEVKLLAGTAIAIPNSAWWEWAKEIELISGGLEAEVSPQANGSPMTLTSGDARAEVVGTTLSFHLNEQRTRLEVSEGAVRFFEVTGGNEVLVETGRFAESGASGFKQGLIDPPPVPGITGFTLMNAESDLPIREEVLVDGEVLSLKALPTQKINIRADYEGAPPESVLIQLTRVDGLPTGLPGHTSSPHKEAPFFVAGDHWADGRPNDCSAWTPAPGRYRLRAVASYHGVALKKPLQIGFRIIR
ncbi:FecR family protein [Akkermansiaceae bacterium]|nr:FecR family protein [Akkermansiaceae bacterium]